MTETGEEPKDAAAEDRWPPLWLCGLHVAALWALAVPQPLFNLLSDAPEFFVAHGNPGGDITAFALGLTLLPPLAMFGVEALARLADRRLQKAVHLLFITVLIGVIAVQALKGTHWGSTVLIPLSAGIGAAVAVAYARFENVRFVGTVISPAPLVILFLFLIVSPVHRLVLPESARAAGAASVKGNTPVIFIVFDEFAPTVLERPDQSVNGARYPHYAELARHSTWYPNLTTLSGSTPTIMPAILASQSPHRGRVPTTLDYPNNLFSLLGGNYQMNVQEPVTQLCPTKLCGAKDLPPFSTRMRALYDDLKLVYEHELYPDDLARDLPPVDREWKNFGGHNKNAPAFLGNFKQVVSGRSADWKRFITRIGPAKGGKPPLDFLHILVPHLPYTYLPNGQQYFIEGEDLPGIPGVIWTKDPFPVEQAQQRFILQVGYTDKLIGQLMARLKKLGIFDRSLIVVTADEGVGFLPGISRRDANRHNFSQIANVPLFIKAPGQTQGRVDRRHVVDVDILPTIADLLGAKLDFPVDGHSLTKPPVDRPVRVTNVDFSVAQFPFSTFLLHQKAEIRRIISIFGSGPLSALFAFGPHKELIGQHAASLPQGTPRPGQIGLYNPPAQFWQKVNPRAPVVPVWIRAKVATSDEEGDIAIAVNGRIAAVSRTYDAKAKFSALLPPSAFKRGANQVEFFQVRDASGGGVELTSLGTVG